MMSSCCNLYEFGEKLNKIFLNLEKKCECQNSLQSNTSKSGELTDDLQQSVCLMTIDFQKAFDSLNHCFLLAALCQYSFGADFLIG